MPSDHSTSNHLTHPCRSFNTLPLSSTGPLCGYRLRPSPSRLADNARPNRVRLLQTGRSPPVASHPASWRRSYVRLQARRAIGLKRTYTFLTSCAHGRTGSGFQPRWDVRYPAIAAAGLRTIPASDRPDGIRNHRNRHSQHRIRRRAVRARAQPLGCLRAGIEGTHCNGGG